MVRLPFNHSPRLAARFARLHRLKRKGLAPATDKASLREAAEQAIELKPITHIQPGKRTRSETPD